MMDLRAALDRLALQGLGQRGLADARLAADQHQVAAPGERGGEGFAQAHAFPRTPNEQRRECEGPPARFSSDDHRNALTWAM